MVAAVAKVVEGNQCPRVFAHASGNAAPKLRPLQEANGAGGCWRVVNRVNRRRRRDGGREVNRCSARHKRLARSLQKTYMPHSTGT